MARGIEQREVVERKEGPPCPACAYRPVLLQRAAHQHRPAKRGEGRRWDPGICKGGAGPVGRPGPPIGGKVGGKALEGRWR